MKMLDEVYILDLDLDFSDREFAILPKHYAPQRKGLHGGPCFRKTKKVVRTGHFSILDLRRSFSPFSCYRLLSVNTLPLPKTIVPDQIKPTSCDAVRQSGYRSVSYTHLTLPTRRTV